MHSTPPSRYDGIPAARGTQVLASPIEPASLPSCERDRLREREIERANERDTVCSLCHLQKKHLGLLQPYIVQCPDTMSALIPDRARQRDRESERAVKQRQRERNITRE